MAIPYEVQFIPDSGDEADRFNGTNTDDTIFVSASSIIRGRAGDDFIDGSEFDDLIYGGAGNDVLRGNGGDDFLSGGTGNDALLGGDGFDTLNGGEGTDTLTGGGSADVFAIDFKLTVAGTEEQYIENLTSFNAFEADLTSTRWWGDQAAALAATIDKGKDFDGQFEFFVFDEGLVQGQEVVLAYAYNGFESEPRLYALPKDQDRNYVTEERVQVYNIVTGNGNTIITDFNTAENDKLQFSGITRDEAELLFTYEETVVPGVGGLAPDTKVSWTLSNGQTGSLVLADNTSAYSGLSDMLNDSLFVA